MSFDDPTAHQDQDWSVTYEGALPTVNGIAADIDSTKPHSDPDAFQTLTFTAPGRAVLLARGSKTGPSVRPGPTACWER